MLADIAALSGRRAPKMKLPRGAAVSAGLGRRSAGALHRQGAVSHRRCAAHVALSHVLLFRQGEARTGLSRRGPIAKGLKDALAWFGANGYLDMIAGILFGFLPLAIWLYLLLGRDGFWLLRERDTRAGRRSPARWPSVVAVVPARNEADVIAAQHRQPAGPGLSGRFPRRAGGRPVGRRHRRSGPRAEFGHA